MRINSPFFIICRTSPSPYLYGIHWRNIPMILLLMSPGCMFEFPEEQVLIENYQQRKILVEQMNDLQLKVDSIWLIANIQLDHSLPVTMPDDDRNNILQIRNADLIQMFEVYDSLDINLQNLIKTTGAKDWIIAQEMREVMTKIDMLDSVINSNLELLSKKDNKKARLIQSQFESRASLNTN